MALVLGLTAFHTIVSGLALRVVFRLAAVSGETLIPSATLRGGTMLLASSFPPLAAIALGLAWSAIARPGQAAALALAPLGWLVVIGIVFAVVDFAEDGEFDWGGRSSPARPKS